MISEGHRGPLSRRGLMFILVVLAVLIVAVAGRVGSADEHGISQTCDTWYQEREQLRGVLEETDGAIARARAAGSTEVKPFFDDLDRQLGILERWQLQSSRLIASLNDVDAQHDPGRRAVQVFVAQQEGFSKLRHEIEYGHLDELEFWAPEAHARFETVSELCLAAD